ncbi:MAG: gluconokinase [Thermodesulfobacteriota bacterium]|nr:gluconokinase [Thermodesulfobacteriota bacterium]
MTNIIDDLQNPDSLPDKTKNVSVVQTHISTVFVADDFVYKVKKPVNFGFLDFSTLEKRHYYCNQEVKLNRRLARDIYIDVLPVTFDGKTYTMIDSEGEAVEYAVKMKRVPDENLMKSVFERKELGKDHLKTIADVLARFHSNALGSSEIDEFGRPEKFKINTDENFEQVEKYIGVSIWEKEFNSLKTWTEDFYGTNQDLFLKRIEQGKIRDCHGDLHMEHICLLENLPILDCIEFNDRFRYSDVIADIAFLLMDLEYHGGETFSRFLWEEYKKRAGEAGEKEVDLLLTFYKVYRAFVRGKVNTFQVDDEAIGKDKKNEAVERAKRYFRLACSYVQ